MSHSQIDRQAKVPSMVYLTEYGSKLHIQDWNILYYDHLTAQGSDLGLRMSYSEVLTQRRDADKKD